MLHNYYHVDNIGKSLNIVAQDKNGQIKAISKIIKQKTDSVQYGKFIAPLYVGDMEISDMMNNFSGYNILEQCIS